MNRWTLLKHERVIDQMSDVHYDFLLENGQDCKTWKLLILPKLDGPSVAILKHTNHRLKWLTVESKCLTNNRGFVQRVDNGTFKVVCDDINRNDFSIMLKGKYINGLFKKNANSCQLISLNQ